MAIFELKTRTASDEPSSIMFEMNKEEVKSMKETLAQIKGKFDEVLS